MIISYIYTSADICFSGHLSAFVRLQSLPPCEINNMYCLCCILEDSYAGFS